MSTGSSTTPIFSDLDRLAVDTVRVLAADAVQKVGNGHPGTAMSLAPLAYLLFQKVMRHDPNDQHWAGRDRFVLSAGHSSLTLYIQLYLGGFGLELEDLESLRTWGSRTPGHPEYKHTPGVETTTGPLGQGVGNAVGMAMAARRERGLFDPDAAPGSSPFDHHIYVIASDGDIEEGVSAEASSLAGVQELGNLTLIYDQNEISIEDNTAISLGEDVALRYEAYGWHVQPVDWTHGGTQYAEDVEALYAALEAAKAETSKPSFIALRTIIGWPAPTLQNTYKAHGNALGDDEVAGAKKALGFDPEKKFEVADEVIAHTRQLADRGREAHAEWDKAFDAWSTAAPDRRALFDRMSTRTLPDGWQEALPTFDADPKGMATRKASGEVLSAIAPGLPELWGGSADLAESQQHHAEGRAVVPAAEPHHQGVERRLLRPGAALRHPRARDGLDPQRDGPARRHPALRRHLPDLQRLHAPGRPARVAHGAAGHLCVDPRLRRARRGRADAPAGRAPRRPSRHPRTRRRAAGGRQRDRGRLADRARATTTGRPVSRCPGRTCRSSRAGPTATPPPTASPKAGTSSSTPRARPTSCSSAPARNCSTPWRHASSWPPRASRPAWSRCRAASGSTSRTRTTATA